MQVKEGEDSEENDGRTAILGPTPERKSSILFSCRDAESRRTDSISPTIETHAI